MTLTKEHILAVTPKLQEIDVPEWGGSVFIRPVTLAEQAKLADLGVKYEKGSISVRMKSITLQLVQWAVTDSEGLPLFEAKDIEALMNKSASALLRLQEAILKFSGLTEDSRRELEKNLLSAPGDEPALP
jgi:hypothetical protein